MAGKKEGGDIKFDVDSMDDLDWPDFDFDEAFKEPKDDRSPIRKVASTSMKAAAKTVADPARIRKTLAKTMPGAYSDAVGVSFDAAASMKDVFDAGLGEVSKTKQDLQRTIRRTLPKVRGSVPDKLGKLLEKLGGAEDYDGGSQKSKEQERHEDISGRLDEIMGVQNEQNVAEKEIGEARRLNNEVTSRKRFTTQMAAFTSMDTSLRQLRDYNEGIDSRWKRKTLELQMSQNFMLSDLVETAQRTAADTITRLDAIAKNTGLPEASKIVMGEEFKRLNQARILEHVGKGLYGGLGEYLGKTASGIKGRVTSTVAGKLRSFRDGARDVGDMTGDMIQMQKDAKENGQDDSLGSILELAMGAGSDWAVNKYGDKAKAKLGGINKFNGKQGFVRNLLTNGSRMLDEQAGKRGDVDGAKGWLLDIARSFLHTSSLDGSVKGNDLLQGHMPDNFNKNTNISIISIIPGLLARQHHELVKIRTGRDDIPMIRFDMSSGTFTDSKSMVSRVKNALMTEGQDKYNREGLDKVVDSIDTKKKLSGSQRAVLQRHLAELNLRRRKFDVKSLADGGAIHGPGSAEDKEAIRNMLRENHGIRPDGSMETGKDQLAGHEADIGQMLNAMNHNFADPTGAIKALIDSGYQEELLAAGYLKNEKGRISIDFDKVTEMRLGHGDGGGTDQPDTAYAPKGIRLTGGGKGAGNKATAANTQALNDLLNHQKALPAPTTGQQFDYGQMGVAVAKALTDSQAANDDKGTDKMDTLIEAVKSQTDTYNSGYQTMVLEEIMDILQDGRQFANVKVTDDLFIVGGKQLGSEAGVWKNRAKRLGGGIRNKLSGAKNFLTGKLNSGRKKVTGALAFGRDKIAQGSHMLDNFRGKVVDIYVQGWERAALEAKKLEAGMYRDKVTGKIIKKLSDIKGEVEEIMADGTSRIVLSLDDIKAGLHDRLGKRVILAGIKNIKDLGTWGMEKVSGKYNDLRKKVTGAIGKAKDWVWGKLAGLHDVYIQGEAKPRLLKFILDQGGYIDAATGNVIKKLSDIKGDVKDLQGNVVLSLDDMRKGLVDQYGESIKANWLTAMTRITRGVNKVKDLGKRALGGLKKIGNSVLGKLKGFGSWGLGLAKGLGAKITNMFSDDGYSSDILKAQLEVQMSILDQLAQLNPKNRKRKVGDKDGDGIVEGSWQDILAKRNAKKDGAKGAANDDSFGPDKKLGPLAKLTAALGGLGSKIKDMFGKKKEEDSGFGLDDAADAADLASHGKGILGKAKRWGGKGLKWGGRMLGKIPGAKWLGRGLNAGKNLLLGAGGRAAIGAGLRTAGGWALRAALGTGAVAAGIISAPVAAVIGTVIGVASLAWMAYKWYDSNKDRPLQKLRLMQYGWSGKNDDEAKKLLAFEDKILKHAKVNGGKLDITAGGDDATAAMKELGIDPDKPKALAFRNFNAWFNNRFRPVFSDWMVAMDKLGIKEDLPSVDDKLNAQSKTDLLAIVKDAGKAGWGVGAGPMEDMDVLTSESAIQAQAVAAKVTFDKDAPDPSKKKTELPLPAAGAAALAASRYPGQGPAPVTGGAANDPGVKVTPVGPAAAAGAAAVTGLLAVSMGGGGGGTKASNQTPPNQFPQSLLPKSTLDPLRTIRMRAYGLTTLDTNLVNNLLYLEWAAQQKMKSSSDGSAEYTGTLEELIALVGPRFGVGQKGSDTYEAFKQWLDIRFLGVWKAYVGAAKVILPGGDPLMLHDTAKPSQMYKLAESVIGAGAYYKENYTSVWSIPLSPVFGMSPNLDSKTIVDNMKTITSAVEKEQLNEVGGKDGKVKDSNMSQTKGFFSSAVDTVKGWFGGDDKSSSSSNTGSSGGSSGSFWDKFTGGGGDTSQAGGTLASGTGGKPTTYNPGGDYSAQAGGGVGAGNYDPNGGPGGNINDLPLPTGPKGFEEHKDLIAAVAKMTGMDPAVLAGLMATESGFNSGIRNKMGSATGLGQFIDGTWKMMIGKYGKMFGIKPGTPATDARANALMTVMYMKDNAAQLKQSLGRDNFTDVDLYGAHFLGAGGYAKAMKNLDAIGPQLMPTEAKNNPSIFWVDGDKNKPRTMRQILALQGAKQVKNRNKYGAMMNAYLASRGEKVNNDLLQQQAGIDPLHGDQSGGLPATTTASTGPGPDDGALGTAPTTGPTGEKPNTAAATVARQANAGGANIAAGPAQPPELLAASNKPAASSGGGGAGNEIPTNTMPGSDPAAQSQAMANQASAQTTSAGNTTGGMDKLVDIGTKQLQVQTQLLSVATQLLKAMTDRPAAPQNTQPGPMNVKAPQVA